MRKLELGGGLHALVDDEDYARLSGYRYGLNRLPDGSLLVHRRETRGPALASGRRPRRLLSHDVLGLPRGSGLRVSYLNGDRLDCRRGNLRVEGGSVAHIADGSRPRKPFRALIGVDGRHYHLGYYPREEMARWACSEGARVARGLRGRGLTRAAVRRELDLAVGRDA